MAMNLKTQIAYLIRINLKNPREQQKQQKTHLKYNTGKYS
jgi:hypothetical protein